MGRTAQRNHWRTIAITRVKDVRDIENHPENIGLKQSLVGGLFLNPGIWQTRKKGDKGKNHARFSKQQLKPKNPKDSPEHGENTAG